MQRISSLHTVLLKELVTMKYRCHVHTMHTALWYNTPIKCVTLVRKLTRQPWHTVTTAHCRINHRVFVVPSIVTTRSNFDISHDWFIYVTSQRPKQMAVVVHRCPVTSVVAAVSPTHRPLEGRKNLDSEQRNESLMKSNHDGKLQ